MLSAKTARVCWQLKRQKAVRRSGEWLPYLCLHFLICKMGIVMSTFHEMTCCTQTPATQYVLALHQLPPSPKRGPLLTLSPAAGLMFRMPLHPSTPRTAPLPGKNLLAVHSLGQGFSSAAISIFPVSAVTVLKDSLGPWEPSCPQRATHS